MKRLVIVGGVAVAASLLCARPSAAQQAMLRGIVVDEAGQPLPGVKVELECMEDKRPKKYTLTTDKKGGYVRVGLPGGACKITYSKEGYAPAGVEVTITLGGLSEVPTVTLKPRPAAAVSTGAPGAAPAPAKADAGPGAGGAGGQAAAPPDVTAKLKETFAKAVEAGKAGQLDQAEALYKDVLAAAPNAPEVHFNLGVIYRRRKDWPSAEAEFKKAVELQPDHSGNYAALAAMYEASGQMDKAMDVLTQASPRFEQDGRFQFQLGVACMNAGRQEEAAAAFRKAVELDPSNPEGYFYLGTLAVSRNQIAEAISSLEKYVALTGQNPQNLATAQGLLKALKAAK
jgi:Flp pilus assembly protein TadD